MIDRNARDRAADLLRRFIAGEITNGEMFRVWPESEDEGVIRVADAVMEQVAAVTGDLFSEATAIFTFGDGNALGPGGLQRLERFRLFLESDCDYTWSHRSASFIGWYMLALVLLPSWVGIIGYQGVWIPLLLAAAAFIVPLVRVRRADRLRTQRDQAVLNGPWPFADDEQLRAARAALEEA